MLETTVLSVFHWGEREPRKLLPYIQSSDAFSVEWAGCTERTAAFFESKWAYVLGNSGNITRSAFLKAFDKHLNDPREPLAYRQYKRAVFDYLFRNRIAACFSERWEKEEDGKEVVDMYKSGDSRAKQGLALLNQGEAEGLQMSYEGWKTMLDSASRRDANIAQNLKRMEALLKDAYPHLRKKEVIRLAMMIGYSHRVERYADVICPESLVDMSDPLTQLISRMDELTYGGAPLHEAEPVLRELAPHYRKIFW